jgi:pyruvate/2-oxoglutarate/acetoin dehydrogenase E1 component
MPIFSRLVSLDHPEVLEEGMVFALETYWPASDGWSAARIEEEIVVTADGCEVITKFPAEELLVAGRRYWTVDGPLNTRREAQSHLNTRSEREHMMADGLEGLEDPEVARGTGEADGVDDATNRRELLALYEQMALIRRTEKAAHDLFLSGLVKGTTHLAAGHEAIAVGASAALRPDDYVFAAYRGHHHALARGATPEECLAELMSRATGVCRAKGGSMHLTKASVGMLGSYAVVGAHLPMAAGAAWSARLRGTAQIAVAFFGDVVRTANGGGLGFGAQHSQATENWALTVPGLKIAAPSTPADVIGMMAAAVRSDDPVVFFEHKGLLATKGPPPPPDHVVELGRARVVRPGEDVTLVALAAMVPVALEAARRLAEEGVDAEVIDPRGLVPLDTATVLGSLARTSRLVTVEENPYQGGWGGTLVSVVADEGFGLLDAPVRRVAGECVPLPFADTLEERVRPTVGRVMRRVRDLAAY